jgi:hypothetical protein
MQRKLIASLCATAAVAAGVTATSAASHDRHDRDWGERALSAVALTAEQSLLAFRTDRPERARTVGRVRGLIGGDARIIGIDYRPATGDLYGVGDAGGVYVIDDRSARATLRSRLSVPLAGTTFGVDFNPVVDRLRIVSDTGQNLRDNVDADSDTLTDGALTFPGPPPATALGIAGAAYTNSDADPDTGTTLFDLDAALDQVAIQSPANAGLLAPTGKLGVDAGSDVGFDIARDDRRGSTARGFASIASRLYAIDLLSGRASSLGSFPRRHTVTGIAVPTDRR